MSEREYSTPDGQPAAAQPKWRRDFPVDVRQDDYVSRRELVKFMVLTSGAFVVGHVWLLLRRLVGRGDVALPGVAIASIEELPVGGAKTFEYPAGSAARLLVRTGPASFVAYDQQCTHLACPVVPVVAERRLHCPCHNGWFDLDTGQPLAGPPRRPLPRVTLDIRDQTVYAIGIEVSPS